MHISEQYNNYLTKQYFGFTVQDFYNSSFEDAVSIIRRNLNNLIPENNEETEQFVEKTTTEWLNKSKEALNKLEKKAVVVFTVNNDFLSNDEEDKTIVQLKQETRELFQQYLKDKLFLTKIRRNRERIFRNASEIENKIKTIKKLDENHKQLEQFCNYHTKRLLKSGIVSTRYEKFRYNF